MSNITKVATYARAWISRVMLISFATGFVAFSFGCPGAGDEFPLSGDGGVVDAGDTCKGLETRQCTCGDGTQEAQICSGTDAASSWKACPCEGHGDAGLTCTPKATQICACTDGTSAAQVCKDDGSWGTCGCTAQADAGAPLDASVADSGIVCVTGGAQACTCTDGRSGAQSCVGGSWGACFCTGPTFDAGVGQCVTGATQSCSCTDGRPGAQTCNSSHTWDGCTCSGGTTSCVATDTSALCGAACLVNGVTVCLWTADQISHPVFGYCSRDNDGDGLTPEQGDCNDSDRNTRWCHPEISANPPPLCRNTSYIPRDPAGPH